MQRTIPDISTVVAALERCAPGVESCDGCPMKNDCTGIANPAMAAAAVLLRKFMPRQMTFGEVLKQNYDPVYIVSKDGETDCWCFFMAYVEHNGIYICRGMDDQILAFRKAEYGVSWLSFTGRVTDKMWKEIKWSDGNLH